MAICRQPAGQKPLFQEKRTWGTDPLLTSHQGPPYRITPVRRSQMPCSFRIFYRRPRPRRPKRTNSPRTKQMPQYDEKRNQNKKKKKKESPRMFSLGLIHQPIRESWPESGEHMKCIGSIISQVRNQPEIQNSLLKETWIVTGWKRSTEPWGPVNRLRCPHCVPTGCIFPALAGLLACAVLVASIKHESRHLIILEDSQAACRS